MSARRLAEGDMQTVLRGIQLGWQERGRGTPLVLLHAFPLDRRMWDDTARELTLDARVIAVDLRGFGESSGNGTVDDLADDVAALLDHLRIPRAVVGGLSLGGYVALAFARRHATRLAGLLLADTRASADSDEARETRNEAIVRVAREGSTAYVGELVPRLVSARATDARGYAVALASLQSPLGVAGMLATLRDRPDSTALLPTIRVPTAVVVGGVDTVTPPSVARSMADAIPGATYSEIAGAGHLSNLEAPGPFADAVRALLDRVGRAGSA